MNEGKNNMVENKQDGVFRVNKSMTQQALIGLDKKFVQVFNASYGKNKVFGQPNNKWLKLWIPKDQGDSIWKYQTPKGKNVWRKPDSADFGGQFLALRLERRLRLSRKLDQFHEFENILNSSGEMIKQSMFF